MKLNIEPNLDRPDDVYEMLIDAYRDLSDEQVQKMSARLILLLVNHIGDPEALAEALCIARADTTA